LELFKQSSIVQGHEVEFSPCLTATGDGSETVRKNPHCYQTKGATSI